MYGGERSGRPFNNGGDREKPEGDGLEKQGNAVVGFRRQAKGDTPDGGNAGGIYAPVQSPAGRDKGRRRVCGRYAGGGKAQGRLRNKPRSCYAGHGHGRAGLLGAVHPVLQSERRPVLHAQAHGGKAAPEARNTARPAGRGRRIRGRKPADSGKPGDRTVRRHHVQPRTADVLAIDQQGRRVCVRSARRGVPGCRRTAGLLPGLAGRYAVAGVGAAGKDYPQGDSPAGRPDGKAGHSGGILPDVWPARSDRGLPDRNVHAPRTSGKPLHVCAGIHFGRADRV